MFINSKDLCLTSTCVGLCDNPRPPPEGPPLGTPRFSIYGEPISDFANIIESGRAKKENHLGSVFVISEMFVQVCAEEHGSRLAIKECILAENDTLEFAKVSKLNVLVIFVEILRFIRKTILKLCIYFPYFFTP